MNDFERINRQRKVAAFIKVIGSAYDGKGFTPDELDAFTAEQWSMLAAVASTQEGRRFGDPSEETIRLTCQSWRLRCKDVEKAPDPFAGIGGR